MKLYRFMVFSSNGGRFKCSAGPNELELFSVFCGLVFTTSIFRMAYAHSEILPYLDSACSWDLKYRFWARKLDSTWNSRTSNLTPLWLDTQKSMNSMGNCQIRVPSNQSLIMKKRAKQASSTCFLINSMRRTRFWQNFMFCCSFLFLEIAIKWATTEQVSEQQKSSKRAAKQQMTRNGCARWIKLVKLLRIPVRYAWITQGNNDFHLFGLRATALILTSKPAIGTTLSSLAQAVAGAELASVFSQN